MKSVRQKYDEAAKRNAARFFGKGGIAAVIKERSSKGQQIDQMRGKPRRSGRGRISRMP